MTAIVATRDGSERLAPLLARLGELAEDVVVLLDSRSDDDSRDVALASGARVVTYEHDEHFARQAFAAQQVARGEWILKVDDDEFLNERWTRAALERLLASHVATNYWFPRRWVVENGTRFLSLAPWYPDWQRRLIRNIHSIHALPDRLHEAGRVAGEARFVTELWIEHQKLQISDRAQREERAAAYARINPSDQAWRQLLYEDAECETDALERAYPTLSQTRCDVGEGPHRADVRLIDLSKRMRAGHEYPVFCTIANRSSRTMHAQQEFIRVADTHVTDHWYRETLSVGGRHRFGQTRHRLPQTIEPGEVVPALLSIRAPEEAGEYLLQVDLFEENVAWFSLTPERGVHQAALVEVVTAQK